MGRAPRHGMRATSKKQGARSKLRKPPVSAKAAARRSKARPVSWAMVKKVRSKHVHKQTGIEAEVEKWLLDLGAEYKSEHPISRVHVDFYVPVRKLVVEVNGCYWHGCKECVGQATPDQMKKRRQDGRRYTFLRNAGYRLLILWEHEIEKAPEKARDRLQELLHV